MPAPKIEIEQGLPLAYVLPRRVERGDDLVSVQDGLQPLQHEALAGALGPHQDRQVAKLDRGFGNGTKVLNFQDVLTIMGMLA